MMTRNYITRRHEILQWDVLSDIETGPEGRLNIDVALPVYEFPLLRCETVLSL